MIILSAIIRINGGDDPIRGYERHRFQENFGRYLREKEDSDRYTATNADGMGTSGHSQTVTDDDVVTVRTSQKTQW